MSRLLALLLAAFATARGCAEGCLVELDVGDARARAVQTCCDCLAQSETHLGSWEQQPDGGVPGADAGPASCLRDGTAATCSVTLLDDRQLAILGACVSEEGPCTEACADLLAFP